jgi:hypothetical protein
MRKMLLSLGAATLLAAAGFGCAHERSYAYGEKADYEHHQAKVDASHGDFGHAIHNERKSIQDEHKADAEY